MTDDQNVSVRSGLVEGVLVLALTMFGIWCSWILRLRRSRGGKFGRGGGSEEERTTSLYNAR